MGITIHVAALAVCAADVHVPDGDLPTETLTLRESVVNAYFANQNRSALRLAVIDEKQLRDRGASRTYPELLKGIPSLYATSESGSYGDAEYPRFRTRKHLGAPERNSHQRPRQRGNVLEQLDGTGGCHLGCPGSERSGCVNAV